jgi:hypothetical protein
MSHFKDEIFVTYSIFYLAYIEEGGPGSSVGIATDYGLDGPEILSR